MFVVRIVVDDQHSDHKTFSHLADARARFEAGRSQTILGEFDVMALYDVAGTDDPKQAVRAVIDGPSGPDAERVRLLDSIQSTRRALAGLKLNLSFSRQNPDGAGT